MPVDFIIPWTIFFLGQHLGFGTVYSMWIAWQPMSIPATAPLFRRSRLPVKDRGDAGQFGWRGRPHFYRFRYRLFGKLNRLQGAAVFPGCSQILLGVGDAWEMFEQVNMLEKLDQAEA
jgi:hypothetical protein